MAKTTLIRLEFVFLGLILLLGGILRLYHISSYMTFLGDEGRDALVVRDILLGKNFPLIGPGTSVGNMYLGPLYYYFISPSLLLTNFSPVGPAIFVALIGIITIGLVWWVSREWGISSFAALAVAALYAVSPVVIIYSRSSWNPNIMPFFALFCIYGIWRVFHKSGWKWLIVTAISFAFVLNSHYLGLLLAPTIGFFWLISKNKNYKISFLSLLLLLLLLSPLAIFDSRHNWTNFRALQTFFSDRQQTVNFKAYKAAPNLWPIWIDINTTLLAAGNKQLGTAVSVIIVLTLTLTLTHKRKSPELLLVSVWLGIGLLGLGLYKQHIYSHYYGFLFPAPFLLIGLIMKNSDKYLKVALFSLLILLFAYNLTKNPLRSDPNNQLVRTRQVAEFITANSQGRPFNLALLSNHNYDASYRYFLAVEGSPYFPVNDRHTVQLFVICENPDSKSECQPVNNPEYEIAAFGWAKIDREWSFPWQVKVYKLIPNPAGK